MEMGDQLLQLISKLQNSESLADGRRMLLIYIRESSGAQLVSLFIRTNDYLMPLAYVGQRPSNANENADDNADDRVSVPLHGLFGLALTAHLSLPDPYADKHMLPQERTWAWPGGPLLTYVVGSTNEQAILVLSFQAGTMQHPESQNDIQFCLSLLPAYLSPTTPGDEAAGEVRKIIPSQVPSLNMPDSHQELPLTRRGIPLRVPSPIDSSTEGTRKGMPLRDTRYTKEQQRAIDDERKRIARDLHDGVVQQITHVMHKLEYIQHLISKRSIEQALAEIEQSRHVLDTCLHDLRHDISSLIPFQLEEQNFAAALQALLRDYALSDPDLNITTDIEMDIVQTLPRELEATIFRFLQESLNNVRKHAHATHVSIALHVLSPLFVVEVSDNGIGLPDAHESDEDADGVQEMQRRRNWGLRLMRERVQEAGGFLEIQSIAGEGTTLKAYFPLAVTAA